MKHEIEVTFEVKTKIEIEAESREEAEAKIKALDFDQIDDELAWLNENAHPTAFLIYNLQLHEDLEGGEPPEGGSYGQRIR